METNILKALNNITTYHPNQLIQHYKANYFQSSNRINSMGDALELYIQDIFANTLQIPDLQQRNKKIEQTFSYLGNKNNPPDLIIRDGDALEVKKIESQSSTIALNSSHPRQYLYSDDPKLSKACRECEQWQKKDIIYCIGFIENKKVKHLWFIHGDCYAADRESYTKVSKAISSGIMTIPDIDLAETNELGRVNKIDPLGITSLRIRGMWQINNPANVFNYIYNPPENKFGMVCLMRKEKFISFPQLDQDNILANSKLKLEDKEIKNPDNPAQLLDVKLITYS